jgi:hypothetical protein
MKAAIYFLFVLCTALFTLAGADLFMKHNLSIEKQVMESNLDHLMTRTMYEENIISKQVNVDTAGISGKVKAQAVYVSFRGNTCTITIDKELGPLAWSGVSEITKRCKVKPTRTTS